MTENELRPGTIVQHFKRQYADLSIEPEAYRYRITGVAEHTETGEKFVIYEALYGTKRLWARPLAQFLERVDTAKYPDAKQEFRFELKGPVKN